jgi:type II secretory pathway component PulF
MSRYQYDFPSRTFMIFLGVVIGGVVIAMYLPIFNMASAIG